MKKLLCLLLCILMVLPFALTGCSSAIKNDDPNAAKATTIVITTIREEGTTDESIALVQDAFNQLTESLYNTHVVLNMIPASEYEEYVLKLAEKNYLEGDGSQESEDDDEEEEKGKKEEKKEAAEIFVDEDGNSYTYAQNGDMLVYDEYNRTHVKYPDAAEDQLDILLIPNVKFFNTMKRGYVELTDSGAEITNTYLKELGGVLIPEYGTLMKKYVASYNLSALYQLGLGGQTFAIPNNTFYGKYRFLVINKELFDKYQYDPKTVTCFGDTADFITDLMENKDIATPVLNYAGYSWLTYLDFPSMLGLRQANSYSYDAILKLSTTFSYTDYRKTLNLLNDLKQAGYTWSEDENVTVDSIKEQEFGVAMIEGDPNTIKDFGDDYYVVNVERPVLGNDMYDGMYSISSSCAYPSRAMEILMLLSTNESIVNLLAYGVPGTHYELDKNDMVVNRKGGYGMNWRYVGNTFLLKQCEDMSEELLKYSADDWALAKAHNRALVSSPYTGFTLVMNDEIQQDLDTFKELSDGIMARIDKYDEYVGSPAYETYMQSEDHANYVEKNGTKQDEFPYLEYLDVLRFELERSAVYKKITQSGTATVYNTPFQQYADYFLRTFRTGE